MYPLYKTNIIKGAIYKNTVQEIKINFSELSNEIPIIKEFLKGGVYYYYDICLCFTGGQEYIKETGKKFLSTTKLPLINNYHWNHSLVAEKGIIYVIGGCNSNKSEYYDIAKKVWKDIPDLIAKERQRSIHFIENNYLHSLWI